jgi:hypothetical protein
MAAHPDLGNLHRHPSIRLPRLGRVECSLGLPVHPVADHLDATTADPNADPNPDADRSDADSDTDPDPDPHTYTRGSDADPNPDPDPDPDTDPNADWRGDTHPYPDPDTDGHRDVTRRAWRLEQIEPKDVLGPATAGPSVFYSGFACLPAERSRHAVLWGG